MCYSKNEHKHKAKMKKKRIWTVNQSHVKMQIFSILLHLRLVAYDLVKNCLFFDFVAVAVAILLIC